MLVEQPRHFFGPGDFSMDESSNSRNLIGWLLFVLIIIVIKATELYLPRYLTSFNV